MYTDIVSIILYGWMDVMACDVINASGYDVICRYVGQWRDNKKNGVGVLHYNSGSVFEGDFVDDQRHGR